MSNFIAKLGTKKLIAITVAIVIIAVCIAIPIVLNNGNKCKHAYDNACDTTCNECGEERITTHDYAAADCDTPKTCKICGATYGEALGHDWKDADCITPKTCKTCGVTDGNALGHKPAEDDGDCTSSILCTACGAKTTAAKAQHTMTADDGDCSTPVICAECDQHVVYAKTHDFEGAEYRSNETHHWRVCENYGCNVTDEKIEHTPNQEVATETDPKKCTVCEYVMEPQIPHEHTFNVADYNDTYHYIRCDCGTIDESTKVAHTEISDNDCTTPNKCTCGYTVTAGKNHVAGEDDGNCMTLVKCANCDQQAKSGTTDHTDADHDYTCDNPGCQITVGNPPEDTTPGTDLPIDRN